MHAVYVYIYIYLIHVYIYTYVYMCRCERMHAHICAYIHVYICIHYFSLYVSICIYTCLSILILIHEEFRWLKERAMLDRLGGRFSPEHPGHVGDVWCPPPYGLTGYGSNSSNRNRNTAAIQLMVNTLQSQRPVTMRYIS